MGTNAQADMNECSMDSRFVIQPLNFFPAEFEQEKFEMQKQHTKSIQEILNNTNILTFRSFDSRAYPHILAMAHFVLMWLICIFLQINDIVGEFEQEKFEMQKQHTKSIQEILDDTNARLQKMEKEYSQQTHSTVSHIFLVTNYATNYVVCRCYIPKNWNIDNERKAFVSPHQRTKGK